MKHKIIMDSGSVISEPISSHHRNFSKQKSASMTILSPKSAPHPKYPHLDTLESKMSNIEVTQLNSANISRRRKGTSLSGTISSRSSSRSETKELRSALQDREAVIQNLRVQLCLGKLPRPSGPPLDDSERPAAEQKLSRLKVEAENKHIAIRNLKSALDKLDITDNIDTRIRQAELEYALGREELQLLSIVEEVRALQARLDKSKPEPNTLFSLIASGVNLTLHAVQATVGRWAANTKSDSPGLFIEWALDGEGLYRGDRIIEVNGKLITSRTKDELQKQIGTGGKCLLVVLRKKSAPIPQKQLAKQQEDNLRLQHRISYLEEQVKELQTPKEPSTGNGSNGHVTSINISSPPSTPPDKPLVFQRGNYITTLVGGKPIELGSSPTTPTHQQQPQSNVTKTIIKENGNRSDTDNSFLSSKCLSASKISINSDLPTPSSHHQRRERERRERALVQRSGKISENTNQSYHRNSSHARSVEHLNHYNGFERRRELLRSEQLRKVPTDLRSVKSLDFDSENEYRRHSDYPGTEPRVRPTPPKKPLRLSLQRAQSLQTVELNATNDLDKKRSLKRAHFAAKAQEANLIDNNSILQTASLGRHKNM